MNRDTKYFGFEISHLIFDVTDSEGVYHQFKNNASGFKKFIKLLNLESQCVMEVTGYYHYRFAQFLNKNEVAVFVVNPLLVKHLYG